MPRSQQQFISRVGLKTQQKPAILWVKIFSSWYDFFRIFDSVVLPTAQFHQRRLYIFLTYFLSQILSGKLLPCWYWSFAYLLRKCTYSMYSRLQFPWSFKYQLSSPVFWSTVRILSNYTNNPLSWFLIPWLESSQAAWRSSLLVLNSLIRITIPKILFRRFESSD
jgi:hypothetical protein